MGKEHCSLWALSSEEPIAGASCSGDSLTRGEFMQEKSMGEHKKPPAPGKEETGTPAASLLRALKARGSPDSDKVS